MEFFENIVIVAKYEAKTLRRSWFFRLFFLMSLFIFTFLNLGLFSPIGDQPWDIIAIPSALPFTNLYFLNIAQAIVVIFLAADFLKRDKKVDTNEVLYTRSMSNLEYVLGKTWGILRLFLGLNIIVLSIGLIINIINKEMSVDILSYLEYLILISIPTLVFSLGIAFMLMIVIKNQAITFLILLGLAAGNMFWGYYRLGGIFDYMSFGLPMFKSDITGFDNLRYLLEQRGLYLTLGLSLVFATTLLFNRLPQSKLHQTLSWIFMVLFFCCASVLGTSFIKNYKTAQKLKEGVIEINKIFENRQFATLTDVDIDMRHLGTTIESTAGLKFTNENKSPLNEYLFSLNPSLTVSSINTGTKEIPFTTNGHIIEVTPEKPLLPGETDSLYITYSGSINEPFCFPDYTDNIKENPYIIEMLNVNKRQAFLYDDYLLLTPETHWYPVAGLNYYPSSPARLKIDFSKYTLRVKTAEGLTAVSQGEATREGDTFVFAPTTPLTGITLAIGRYKTDKLVVDSITYINNYIEGHDYYKETLAEIADTLPSLVTGFMRDLEINFTTSYPFPTLSFVEVPIQFYSYPRLGTQTRSELQPSLMLVPEKLSTMDNAGFAYRFKRQKRRMERNNEVITDKELKVRLFNDFVTNSFIIGNRYRYVDGVAVNEPTRYRLGPSFYFFKNNFYSNEYPVINSVFETHLQKLEDPVEQGNYMGETNNITDNDLANMTFMDYSFGELLSMRPLGDTLSRAIALKGDFLFSLLRAKGGISEFDEWFKGYVEQNKFKSISLEKLDADIKERFGFDFYGYIDDWYNGKAQPGFRFANLQASEVVVDSRVRYQVKFVAYNPEKVSGLFNISFNTSEEGGQNAVEITDRGRGMESSNISKIVVLDPGEVKEIGIILDAQPRAMIVNTIFAKNIPGLINFPINEISKAKSSSLAFAGETILPEFPEADDPGVIIVDNEDENFSTNESGETSPLRRLLKVKNDQAMKYDEIRTWIWAIPDNWQAVLQNTFYGKYVLSSVYTRSGNGEKELTWTTEITQPGFYEISCFVGKALEGAKQGVTGGVTSNDDETVIVITVGGGGQRPESDNTYKDMHYTVYHDDGADEIVFDYSGTEGGWNSLGNYFLSAGTAKVTLSNKSEGNIVIGDAIRWRLIE